jgi:hypothetical protein
MGAASVTGPHKELAGEVRDLLALEIRLQARVETELGSAAVRERPEVRALLQRLEPRAYAHQSALEQALHRLHGRAPVLRRSLAASLGRVARWVQPAPAWAGPTGDLCDIYALLSATAAAYLVLAASARAAGDAQTTALAERCADDTDEFLDEIALLLPELAREGMEGATGSEPSEPDGSGTGTERSRSR